MISFDRFTLDNGLRIISHEDRSSPLVAVNILYDVGSKDEHPGKTGFAHLFEHLMFGGSVNIPQYDEPLERAGGQNNAFTSEDITDYYLTLPAQNIETGFWLESDRMMGLAFSPKSLEVQRNVVIEEFKQRYLNQPYGDIWLLLRPLVFTVHPYRWDTIGKDITHIEQAVMDDVKAFYRKHYNPRNAIMTVSGNISSGEVIPLAQKWFGPVPDGILYNRNLPAEPVQKEPRHLTVERDVPYDVIYKAYKICRRTDPPFYSLDLISEILSMGNSSRLYNELVKEKKLFSEIDAYLSGELEGGMFVISGKLVEGVKMEQAEKAIEDEIKKILENPAGERELEKVKNRMESSRVFGEMNILNKAINLSYYELIGGAAMINSEVEKYRMVTADDIMTAAGNYLAEQQCSTLYYLARKKK